MLKLIAVVVLTAIALTLMLIGIPILEKSDDELILNEHGRTDIDNSL